MEKSTTQPVFIDYIKDLQMISCIKIIDKYI